MLYSVCKIICVSKKLCFLSVANDSFFLLFHLLITLFTVCLGQVLTVQSKWSSNAQSQLSLLATGIIGMCHSSCLANDVPKLTSGCQDPRHIHKTALSFISLALLKSFFKKVVFCFSKFCANPGLTIVHSVSEFANVCRNVNTGVLPRKSHSKSSTTAVLPVCFGTLMPSVQRARAPSPSAQKCLR